MSDANPTPGFVEATDLPAARPHGNLEPVTENIWFIEGTSRIGLTEFPRTMVICRDPATRLLTLIHPIRLSPEGEDALLELGEVTDLVRPGLHGMDVAYYQSRQFRQSQTSSRPPALWSFKSLPDMQKGILTNELVEDGALPGALESMGAKVLVLHSLPPKMKEAAFLIPTSSPSVGNVLVVGDCIQSWEKPAGNFWMRNMGWFLGFHGKCIVGPFWKKMMLKEIQNPTTLRDDLERILKWDFKTLLSGHGTIRDGTAHEGVTNAIEVAFPT